MSSARRPHLDQRRRMVIYSQRREDGDLAKEVARSPRSSEELYSRRNTASYGSRVHRRLRARWYGLVPVKRRTLIGFVASLCGLVALLAWGHWASLWWAPVAMRPDVARPLQLDRPDSFGAWFGAVFLAMTSGAAFLVYQLRRYRSDDYRGHYRLWRIVIVVAMLASIDSVTQLTDWLGATLDAIFGQREVMAGSQWVRILWMIGGAAFAVRLTGEVWKDRSASSLMVVTWSLFAIPAATHWNLIRWDMESGVFWLPVIALAARTLMFATVVTYLRTLYREVRGLAEKDRLQDRIRAVIPQSWARRSREESLAPEAHAEEAPKRKRKPRRETDSDEERPAATGREDAEERLGWWGRWRTAARVGRATRVDAGRASENQTDGDRDNVADDGETQEPSRVKTQGRQTTVTSPAAKRPRHDQPESSDGENQSTDGDSNDPAERKRWWSLRMPKWNRRAVSDDGSEDSDGESAALEKKRSQDAKRLRETAAHEETGGESEPSVGKRRRWWSLKRSAVDVAAEQGDHSEEAVENADNPSEAGSPKRRWWSLRKASAETSDENMGDDPGGVDEAPSDPVQRRWWPLGRKIKASDSEDVVLEQEEATEEATGRRWWAFGRRRETVADAEGQYGAPLDAASGQDSSEEQGALKKRRWWPARFSRSEADMSADEDESAGMTGASKGTGNPEPKRAREEKPREPQVSRRETEVSPQPAPSKGPLPVREVVRKSAEAEYDNDGYDESDDDDSSDPQDASMSKAERRRLRKLQKRQGRAA